MRVRDDERNPWSEGSLKVPALEAGDCGFKSRQVHHFYFARKANVCTGADSAKPL